jgi:hypothetical protein
LPQLRNDVLLPRITMPAPDSFFIVQTSSTMLLVISLVLFYVAFFIVRERTTFSDLFIPSATAGIACRACSVGQYPAIISYVILPNNSTPPQGGS